MFLSLFGLAALISSTEPCELRLTCQDGNPLGALYESVLSDSYRMLMDLRELAIQASNPSMGRSDRKYLNDEKEKMIETIENANNETVFQDSFKKFYSPFKDGIKFTLAYKSPVSDGYLVSQFNIPSLVNIGKVASETFQIRDLRTSDKDLMINLSINGIDIANSEAINDTLSTEFPWASSISWANKMNEYYYLTGVQAFAEPTLAKVAINTNAFPVNSESLKINNVSISLKNIATKADLLQAINSYRAVTSVEAVQNSESELYLKANDGRNIILDLQSDGDLKHLFRDLNETGTSFNGKVKLISSKPIEIIDFSAILLNFEEQKRSIDLGGSTLKNISFMNAQSAIQSLQSIDAGLEQLNEVSFDAARLLQACTSTASK